MKKISIITIIIWLIIWITISISFYIRHVDGIYGKRLDAIYKQTSSVAKLHFSSLPKDNNFYSWRILLITQKEIDILYRENSHSLYQYIRGKYCYNSREMDNMTERAQQSEINAYCQRQWIYLDTLRPEIIVHLQGYMDAIYWEQKFLDSLASRWSQWEINFMDTFRQFSEKSKIVTIILYWIILTVVVELLCFFRTKKILNIQK